MGLNLDQLNKFASGMADLQMSRSPLSQEVIIIFNETYRDHYQDTVQNEVDRVKKLAVVKKDVDMNYVQQIGDILLEDIDQLPWVVSTTVTNLPRLPKMDDQILIDGLRYTISMVKPSNRFVDSIILLSVYPDRTDEDNLDIYSITKLSDGSLDILYGGYPKIIKFDDGNTETISDFSSYIIPPFDSGWITIEDDEGNSVRKEF